MGLEMKLVCSSTAAVTLGGFGSLDGALRFRRKAIAAVA